MRKGHEFFGGLNFAHLHLDNVGVLTATVFELTSLVIARIVPLGFPCIIKAGVDISQAGAHCRWDITLTSSLLLCSLRRIFLFIVILFHGWCFYTQTCLRLLHLLYVQIWGLSAAWQVSLSWRWCPEYLWTTEICAVWLVVFQIPPNLKYRLQMCSFSSLKEGSFFKCMVNSSCFFPVLCINWVILFDYLGISANYACCFRL